MSNSVVYFVQCGISIKIGHTSDLKERLDTIQTSQPERVVLLHTEDGGRVREEILHRRFASHNIRGEWFRSHKDILDYIKEQSDDMISLLKLSCDIVSACNTEQIDPFSIPWTTLSESA